MAFLMDASQGGSQQKMVSTVLVNDPVLEKNKRNNLDLEQKNNS